MRRRILLSILAVVILTTLLLGLPLMYTAWLWVEDVTRNGLQDRLGKMAAEIIAQEGDRGMVDGPLNTSAVRLLIPDGGRLIVVYPTPSDSAAQLEIGEGAVGQPISESLSMGASGSLRLEVPSNEMRETQRRAVFAVALVVLASMAAGTIVAVVTARRLSDPLRDVAARAARLAEGDFRPDPRRHGVVELDRVSDVLDSATVEIAGRLQRERSLVADVSHQLRSRLTAVRLRLDELSVHDDPAVVDEAEAAMAQVDRLTSAIDDLLRSSRDDGAARGVPVSMIDELSALAADWQRPFEEQHRKLRLIGDRSLRASVTGSRLREAVSVLIDNSLVHGGGSCVVSVRMVGSVGDHGPSVCVEVADEGDGVSDALVPHIFDRGFSGSGSTGVGLALARALVEADGGRLELQKRRPAVFALFFASASSKARTSAGAEPTERPEVAEPR